MKTTRIRLGLTCTIIACLIVAVLCTSDARAGRPVPWTANYTVHVWMALLPVPDDGGLNFAGQGDVRADQNFHVIASNPHEAFSMKLSFSNPANLAVYDHEGQLAIQPSNRGTTAFFSYFFPEYVNGEFHSYQLKCQAGDFSGDWKGGTFTFSSNEVVLYDSYGNVSLDHVYSVRVEGTRK